MRQQIRKPRQRGGTGTQYHLWRVFNILNIEPNDVYITYLDLWENVKATAFQLCVAINMCVCSCRHEVSNTVWEKQWKSTNNAILLLWSDLSDSRWFISPHLFLSFSVWTLHVPKQKPKQLFRYEGLCLSRVDIAIPLALCCFICCTMSFLK